MAKEAADRHYDVIVIGAGMGGLTAASLPAKAGKKVFLAEKDPRPGVRVASEGGMKYAVLTTKHGYGHALWDSRYTGYDVEAGPPEDYEAFCRGQIEKLYAPL